MKLKSILIALALLTISTTLGGSYVFYTASITGSIAEYHHMAENRLKETLNRIEIHFNYYQRIAANMAGTEGVIQALTKPGPETQSLANLALDRVQNLLDDSVCYLIAGDGTTIASSNRHESTSFMGKNHAFHPYFQQAMQGKPMLYPAVGVTTKLPGVYLSQTVYDRSAPPRPIGVAVIKMPLHAIQKEIDGAAFNGLAALTGPNNLIFLANDKKLYNQSLYQLSKIQRADPRQSNLFGSGPWQWSGFKQIHDTLAFDSSGKEYSLHRKPIVSLPGWHFLFLHDIRESIKQTSITLLSKVGGLILGIWILIAVCVALLYRMADHEIIKRKKIEQQLIDSQNNLETDIAERTSELIQANARLRDEADKNETTTLALKQSNQVQEAINNILHLSKETSGLEEFLNRFITYTTSLPELGVLPKGAIFLTENKRPGFLILKAHRGLAEQLLTSCRSVAYGYCLCGRAAQSGQVVFRDCLDKNHDVLYEGITPHGHYCIPIFSSNRQIIGVYTVYTDERIKRNPQVEEFLVTMASVLGGIIQNRRAERLARENEEKSLAITNTANDAIFMIDHHCLITYWNPAAEKIFGYTREEAIGLDIHMLIAPQHANQDDQSGFVKCMKNCENPALEKTIEKKARRKDSVEFPIELSLSNLHLGSNWTGVGIVRDISDRKKAEDDAARTQVQLRQAQKMQAIGTLAGGIAHDFNNILTSILGYADLVMEDLPLNSVNQQDMQQIITSGQRAKDLVKRILTFSRQNEQEIMAVQVDLLVKESLKLLRASIPSSIEIRQQLNAETVAVQADPSQIQQVLMNLCTNAFHAMRDNGGVLEVGLETFIPDTFFKHSHTDLHHDRYLVLVVRDTGSGMDAATMARIFEPYFSTNKKGDGTGLGLAVVHGIVTSLAGAIEVESRLGAGATFKVFLPLAAPEEAKTQGHPDPLPRGTEHILYVDDEPPIAKLGQRLITSLGYTVTPHTSSIEALETFRHNPDKFDLVMTDESMPNMTGSALAREMLVIRPDLPIILCSGSKECHNEEQLREIGIRSCLMKPANKNELAQVIRNVLDEGNSALPAGQRRLP
jgi:PAS domain S-box-containing protein